MTKQYTSAGKEVLRDGVHFADACSPDEARDIAVAMNEGLARAYIELGECGTCKGVGAHQPNCVERPPVAQYREALERNYNLDKVPPKPSCTCNESKQPCPVHEPPAIIFCYRCNDKHPEGACRYA